MGCTVRRARRLRGFATKVLSLRPDALHLSHTFWAGLTSLIFVLANAENLGLWLGPSVAFGACLAGVMLYDGRYFIIPDHINAAIAAIGGLALVVLTPEALSEHLAIALSAYILSRGANLTYRAIRGQHGLGHGDAKLLGACGLWLTAEGMASALVWALGSALLSVAILQRTKGNIEARTPLPFGVHLALGAWLTWVLGPFVLPGKL